MAWEEGEEHQQEGWVRHGEHVELAWEEVGDSLGHPSVEEERRSEREVQASVG